MTFIGDIIIALMAFVGGGYLGYRYGSRAVAAAQAVASDVKKS